MKILASDFDGTLCFRSPEGEYAYRQEDVQAIKRFQEKGNLFGLNTGRAVACTDNYHEKTKGVIPFDFIIGDSGAEITDAGRTPFYSRLIDPKTALKAKEAGSFSDAAVFFSTPDGYTAVGRQPGDLQAGVLENDEDILNLEIHSMAFETDTIEKASRILRRLEKENLPLNLQQNWTSVDVSPEGCTKGKALKHLAEHFGVSIKDIAAIGDGLNDLSAIEAAGISFAMENSQDELKEAADYIVGSVAEAIAILEELDQKECMQASTE